MTPYFAGGIKPIVAPEARTGEAYTAKKRPRWPETEKKALRRQFDALPEQVQTTRVHFRNVVEKNIVGIVLLGDDNHTPYLNPANDGGPSTSPASRSQLAFFDSMSFFYSCLMVRLNR
jgi:hypothetical protein